MRATALIHRTETVTIDKSGTNSEYGVSEMSAFIPFQKYHFAEVDTSIFSGGSGGKRSELFTLLYEILASEDSLYFPFNALNYTAIESNGDTSSTALPRKENQDSAP
ncbi:MAG: hypothetical protein ACK5MR_18615 [Cumulibacter sp.]